MTRMSRMRKWLLLGFLLGLLFGRAAKANTIKAASCNTSDVQAAINAASNGDTVVIPDGSCAWSSGIITTKQITIQGESVGGVTITDTDLNVNDTLLSFTSGNSFHVTIANLRFLPLTPYCSGSNCQGNYVSVNGSGTQVPLMHDMYFNLPNFKISHAVVWAAKGGVIWNTTFESTDNLTGACGSQVGSDSGSLIVQSPIPWDSPSTMGILDTTGTNNLYIEDSTFSNVGQAPDVDTNGRVVIRHSQLIGSGGLTHGPSGPFGGRQVELYNNSMTNPNPNRNLNRYFWMRAGTLLVTNNNIQAMVGQCYGTKTSFSFIVEGARWNVGGHGCCTGYMCWHQVASGASSTVQSPLFLSLHQSPSDAYQLSDPVYIWNNTGTGQSPDLFGTNDADPSIDNCHNINPATGLEYSTTDFYKAGRDYFYDFSSNPNNGAKPGWNPYTYPHPLRLSSSSGTHPAAPANLGAVVQ